MIGIATLEGRRAAGGGEEVEEDFAEQHGNTKFHLRGWFSTKATLGSAACTAAESLGGGPESNLFIYKPAHASDVFLILRRARLCAHVSCKVKMDVLVIAAWFLLVGSNKGQ